MDFLIFTMLKNSASYGNDKALRAFSEGFNLTPIEWNKTSAENIMLSETFHEKTNILITIMDQFLRFYNTHYDELFTDDEDHREGLNHLMKDWCYHIAPDTLIGYTSFFKDKPQGKSLGEYVFEACENHEAVVDFMIEMGTPITWEHYDRLYGLKEDNPIKKKIKEAAIKGPGAEVLVVNNFSFGKLFGLEEEQQIGGKTDPEALFTFFNSMQQFINEQENDTETDPDLLGNFLNAAQTIGKQFDPEIGTQELLTFYNAMKTIADQNEEVEVLEYGPGFCVFGGNPEVLQKLNFELMDNYTELLPRYMMDKARISNLMNAEKSPELRT